MQRPWVWIIIPLKFPPPLFFCSGKFVIALLLVIQLWLSLYLHWNTLITYKLKEALTPAKKDQSGHVTVDQLSAFDKVLAECDQEAPVKFADFLDSRYRCMYFNFRIIHSATSNLHWMKFITHLSPINFYLTENLNLLVFLRHKLFLQWTPNEWLVTTKNNYLVLFASFIKLWYC